MFGSDQCIYVYGYTLIHREGVYGQIREKKVYMDKMVYTRLKWYIRPKLTKNCDFLDYLSAAGEKFDVCGALNTQKPYFKHDSCTEN